MPLTVLLMCIPIGTSSCRSANLPWFPVLLLLLRLSVLLQLKENGDVDQEYEESLTVPNLPYLNAPWARGSHKRWMTNVESVDKAMYT